RKAILRVIEEFTVINRRFLIIACSGVAIALSAWLVAAPPSTGAPKVDFLFVQTAKAMTFDSTSGKLALEGISPITLFFSDRPERIAGNMETTVFGPFWARGKNSFLSDPPNADVSILEGNKLRQVVVVLQDPVLDGERLTYTAKVLKGDMPAQGRDISVFIDVVGMPATPVSAAGVGRREYRRAVIYH
ncbi:MAG TPA: hypothetical protein VEW74_07305, partial [Candidatus Nitrosotalea sp.]|nr:hypothetical protein [Candidatus Nitrosotalea sp.]